MKNFWKKTLFLDHPPLIRVWMYTAILGTLYFIMKSSLLPAGMQTNADLYIAAYGLGSIGLYVLIYGFDWKK